MYSCLLQICAEFMRLTTFNLVDCLQDMLHKYSAALVRLVENSSGLPMPLSDSLIALSNARNQEQDRGNGYTLLPTKCSFVFLFLIIFKL